MTVSSERWGLWDSGAECWFGDGPGKGPRIYNDRLVGNVVIRAEWLARGAATILNEQFGWKFRIRAKLMPEDNFTFKDRVMAKYSPGEAMRRAGL